MPTSRAPRRFDAQARSALPNSVARKNQPNTTSSSAVATMTATLCPVIGKPPTVKLCSISDGRADAFGPEEGEAEARQREMHAEGGDQQHQHAGVGQRLERDAVDHRPHRHDQRDGEQDVHRGAEFHRRQRAGERSQQRTATPYCSRTISASAAHAQRAPLLHQRSRRRERAQRDQQPGGGRHAPGLERSERHARRRR